MGDIRTRTKWIIALSWFILLFIIIVVVQNLGTEKTELDKQRYFELAREYEMKAATEYELFVEYSERAGGIWREWMSTDQREDYDRYSRASTYHYELYDKYSTLAEEYRQMAQRSQ